MLAIDDKKAGFGVLQITDRCELTDRFEVQDVFRKQKHTPRKSRLRFSRLIKVHDVTHLAAAQHSLKSLFASLDRADELSDRIVGLRIGLNLVALKIESTCEAYATENIRRFERCEVEDPVLLPYSRCQH